MTGFWKKSLAAQLIALILAALAVSQTATFLIFWEEHSKALDDAAKSEFFTRARTMTVLMSTVPPAYREQALLASETRNSRFWLTGTDTEDVSLWRLEAAAQFSRPLENYVDLVQVFSGAPSRPELPDAERVSTSNVNENWRTPIQNLWALQQPVRYTYFDGSRGYGLVIELDDGKLLNAAFFTPDISNWWSSTSLTSLLLTAALLAGLGAAIAGRITRPLRNLARSADALGRGDNLPPLKEDGPEEIRGTAAAFNLMQSRLRLFIEENTKMLAAIGHDLRTPLTALRLRAEFVTDPENQQKMLSTIQEIQDTTEAALELARGGSTEERTRDMQLEALVASICDDLADIGHRVSFIEGSRTTYRCRPEGLRRAVRNLIENAVRYGGEAKVFIRQSQTSIELVVEDRGPGIPEAMMDKVFSPFVRLESSRSRDTGGVGLGLAIARAVARQHGGDISFRNKAQGMEAVITLPKTVQDTKARKFSLRRVSPSVPDHLQEGRGLQDN